MGHDPAKHSQWRFSPDGFNRAGAERLAQIVRDYWTKRGAVVRVWVEPAGEYLNEMRTANWWVVRSDLVNGRPRK